MPVVPGTFKDVNLDTFGLQAVYSGKADFAIPIVTWEVIEASWPANR